MNLLEAPFDCLKFVPTELEIYDRFLTPFIQNQINMQRSLMFQLDLYRASPEHLNLQQYNNDYYPRRGNFWFLVDRHPREERNWYVEELRESSERCHWRQDARNQASLQILLQRPGHEQALEAQNWLGHGRVCTSPS